MENLYEKLWPIVVILGGIYVLISREKLVRQNARAFLRLYEITKMQFFKTEGESFDSTYMRMVSVLVGVIFIVVGVLALTGNV
jgi:hypothetical protein